MTALGERGGCWHNKGPQSPPRHRGPVPATVLGELPWQHKAGSDAEKLTHNCPHGGCTWEMCNPPSDTWTNKAEWKVGDKSDMDWAQPDYCFSYNRASQPSPSRLCQRALTSLARAVPQRSKR